MARQKTPSKPECLGEVTVPSGIVLVVDTGLLGFWTHDQPPLMPPWVASEDIVRTANSGADFQIDGPDAERAGRAFDRQWHPLYVFDIPSHGSRPTQKSFRELVRQHGFNARLRRLRPRVPLRRRADLALEYGQGAGEVFFHGMWGWVLTGVPQDRTLRVLGERMPPGPYEGRWRQVELECQPGGRVARTESGGTVCVDRARLMFADLDALGAWQHEQPLDGLGDYVFWGADAGRLAALTGAPRLAEGKWGWLDLPVERAAWQGRRVEALRDEHGLKVAVDFRPHSHHYFMMAQVRRTPTESGTLEVGGAKMCTWMTSWGDGFFPVLRDLDAEGRLVRVRIDLGCEQTIQRMERLLG
ncbi:MAG: hypothetical protein L0Z62_11500 [Gemmataceae bacterium]|nr:hypothetical protein [Gemmataceae bacterium]